MSLYDNIFADNDNQKIPTFGTHWEYSEEYYNNPHTLVLSSKDDTSRPSYSGENALYDDVMKYKTKAYTNLVDQYQSSTRLNKK